MTASVLQTLGVPPALLPTDSLYLPSREAGVATGNPQTLVVYDFGTKAVKVAAHVLDERGHKREVFRDKTTVKIGHGVFTTGRFDPQNREAALRAVTAFSNTLHARGIDSSFHVAVGTSALRDVHPDDRASFVEDVKRRAGIVLQVITGRLEAELFCYGALNGEHVHLGDGLNLSLEEGGGSTQLAVGFKHHCLASLSLDMGAIRMTELYDIQHPVPDDTWARMKQDIRRQAEDSRDLHAFQPVANALGSGGTIRAMNRLMREWDFPYDPFLTFHLKEVLHRLRRMSEPEIAALKSIEVNRAGIILAGGAVLREVSRAFGIETVRPTSYYLMDGVLDLWSAELLRPRPA